MYDRRVCPKCYGSALEIITTAYFSYDGEVVGEILSIPDAPDPNTPIHCMGCDWVGEDMDLVENK